MLLHPWIRFDFRGLHTYLHWNCFLFTPTLHVFPLSVTCSAVSKANMFPLSVFIWCADFCCSCREEKNRRRRKKKAQRERARERSLSDQHLRSLSLVIQGKENCFLCRLCCFCRRCRGVITIAALHPSCMLIYIHLKASMQCFLYVLP